MTDRPSLFVHQAVLPATALDLIVSHLMLFAPAVYLNCQVRPGDTDVETKLNELIDAGLVKPWALPGEVAPPQTWSARGELVQVDGRQYARTAEMVRAATSDATGALGEKQALRPIEIVQVSTCAWQCGIAESLESDRVVSRLRSFPGLLAALRRTNYQQSVAQEFLELAADLPIGLSALPTDEIIALQKKYRGRMSEWLTAHISSWPAEIDWSVATQTDVAIQELVHAYSTDTAEALRRRRQRPASRMASLALDVLGFFFWPAGLVSIASDLSDWLRDHQDFRVEWFLADLRRAAESQVRQLSGPAADAAGLPPA